MQLSDLVGDFIIAMIPRLHQKQFQKVKLLGVEAGGIWIESQALTNAVLHQIGIQSTPRTPVFFLPYREIDFVVRGYDQPALDEKAFGV